MTSIGNDIVALRHAGAARAKDAKFYSKIIIAYERALWSPDKFSTLPFENFVWLLWSIKESVYKFQKRHNPGLLFSPQKISIKNIGLPANQPVQKFGNGEYERVSLNDDKTYKSLIYSGTDVFYARSTIQHEFVHTVANSENNFENIWWGIKHVEDSSYENQSAAVRHLLLNKLQAIFPNQHLHIQKTVEGCPLLLSGTKQTGIPVSLTHDGNFVAYCFLMGGLDANACQHNNNGIFNLPL